MTIAASTSWNIFSISLTILDSLATFLAYIFLIGTLTTHLSSLTQQYINIRLTQSSIVSFTSILLQYHH
uniref:Uncharacterized protein n=1 Tax=Octopus bimaculoides TaxID=37653 RepID=A0A0L8HU30_OCTBM